MGAVGETLVGWAPRLGALAVALVVSAFLIGRLAPGKRRKIRRAIVPFVLELVAVLVAAGMKVAGRDEWAEHPLLAARLIEVWIIINLSALLLFDIVLPRVRMRFADIVQDLVVGGAYLVAALVALRSAGVNLTGIVASGAVVTAVLGLSLQSTLGNILGGVALQLDDSISVGDWVRLENQTEGVVKEIRWRHTVIETRNWDTVIVPNEALLKSHITILGKRSDMPTQHRMWVHFNVDFRYSPAEVIQAVEEALRSAPIPFVATTPPPNCICFDFARERRDSFAAYAVRYYLTDLASDDPASSAVRVRLYAALKRANIPLAVPAATVFLAQDDVAHAERKAAREQDKRLRTLENVEIFGPLNPDEKQALTAHLRFAPFSRGEVITRQGAEAHYLYILCQGKVEIRVAVDGNTQKAVATVEAPSFFGEMGLMAGEPRQATVVALSEVECYRLDKEAFDRVLRERPEIANEISGILAQRQVSLLAARENLDAEGRRRRLATERNKILAGIQRFFGLDADSGRN